MPGFVENRILYAIMREAVDLVDRGIIDADGMDRCVRWGIGYKLAVIGPMELLDMAGLDIYTTSAAISTRISATAPRSRRRSPIAWIATSSASRPARGCTTTRPRDRGAPRRAGAQARGGAQGARASLMKVWLLDNGSIVIEHTQFLWNVPGPQVRIPVYSVLVESDDGLFLFDTGIDLDHMNRVLPFELPEQTPEQTIPAQLASRVLGLGCHDARQLAPAHRPRRRQQALRGHPNVIHADEVAQARNHEPFEFFGYSDKSWDCEGLNFETVTGDVELATGIFALRDAGPHGRALLAPARSRTRSARPLLFAVRRRLYARLLWRRASNRASTTTRGPASARSGESRISAAEHGAELFYSHDMDAWHTYRHAPDCYEI